MAGPSASSTTLSPESPTKSSYELATPAVRAMLKQTGINISDVPGTGRDGRVTKEDVQWHVASKSSRPQTTTRPPSPAVATRHMNEPTGGEDQLVPLTKVESAMYQAMTRSIAIPHFLYTHTVDFTLLDRIRTKAKTQQILGSSPAARPGSSSSAFPQKLTPLPFIIKAVSLAFQQFPKLNAHLIDSTTTTTKTAPAPPHLLLKASHNFGVAVDTPGGLLVPVIKNVQNHSILSLAAEITRLCALAQSNGLKPADFTGATFTISNVGSIGGNNSNIGSGAGAIAPIIVPPMVAILGVGRVRSVPTFKFQQQQQQQQQKTKTNNAQQGEEEERVVVKRQEQVVLSWSADHRVLDGATVAKAANLVAGLLGDVDLLGLMLR